ncbi:MAG: GGDEF domain-containing protein [Kiritimatiellia bacterium]
MTDSSAPSASPTPPETLLLQDMADACFRQMDQDRMLQCCARGLTRILGGQGAAILVEEMEGSWFLQIYSVTVLPDHLYEELQDLCFEALKQYSPNALLAERCRVEVNVSMNAGPSPSRLKKWTALPLEVDERFQGLLMVDLGGAERLPAKLNVVLHQLCTGLLCIRNMRQLLITDPMTGCFNRWFMDIELSKFCEGRLHEQDAFAVMILDLDHFKKINDLYGHSTGDQVLIQFSEILRNLLSPGDATIRMGGDEFLIWFPQVRARNLLLLGEDLLDKVRRDLKLEQTPEHRVTLSAGLVLHCGEEPEISKDALLERADHALYTSKMNGRDQLTLWTPQLEK